MREHGACVCDRGLGGEETVDKAGVRKGVSVSMILDTSILDGWVLWLVTVLAVLGLLYMLIGRSRQYVMFAIPAAIVVAVVLTLVARWYVESVWKPFPEPIPDEVYAWSGVVVLGVCLGLVAIVEVHGIWRRVLSLIAAILVVVLGLAHVNAHFGEYPTLRAALGLDNVTTIDLSKPSTGVRTVALKDWHHSSGLPAEGSVADVTIPGTASQFTARRGFVYVPPAYSANPRPLLPVLVLIAGQPGSPQDWLTSVRLVTIMDDFAKAHNGVSPVVIIPDGTGTEMGNPLCMDSRLGNAATYLTTDVAAWAKEYLTVETDRTKWAVGGLSYGGTCALQFATTQPKMYPTFLDMSGQAEPTLGSRRATVDAAFGGDESKFVAINPADLLNTKRYPQVSGAFVVGASDGEYRPGLEKLYGLAKASGMNVTFTTVPGGHAFPVWAAGLKKELPWISERLGITTH